MDLRLFLQSHNIEYKARECVSRLSFVGIGGSVTLVTYPKDRGQLLCLLSYLVSNSIPYKVVGYMSNVLPPDGEWGICLICTRRIRSIYFEKNQTVAECGVSLSALCRAMLKEGLVPPVELFGIPATVGGAVYQNAGAFDLSVSDRILSVDFYDPRFDCVVKKDRGELAFSYRRSSVVNEGIVLSAAISCGAGSARDAAEKMDALGCRRRQSQPHGPSLGSVFLRVNGVSAAYYIERAGLKGRRIGGAVVSSKHAGFIVNAGGATAEDYRALVDLVEAEVRDQFQLSLQKEIEIINTKEKYQWLHFA